MRTALSRREFLKYCSLGMAGLLLPERILSRLDANSATRRADRLLGRIQVDQYPLYAEATRESDVIRELAQDSIHMITGITVDRQSASANRYWYELDGSGFAHSRRVQPVRMHINAPASLIPEGGCLGEVTVPFVEAYSSLDARRKRLYRFYYASTFWVLASHLDTEGNVWYELLDDRLYTRFYVPAYAVRMVPDSELTPLAAQVPFEDKKLVVDLTQQTLTVYLGERVVTTLRVSTGVRLDEGGFATPRGAYRIARKRPCRHMYAPPSEFGTGFDLPGVPWVSYFTSDGVAFHGTYWHNDFGVPHSHGCINMSPQAAKWLYRWTTPAVPPEHYFYADIQGTRVVVQ